MKTLFYFDNVTYFLGKDRERRVSVTGAVDGGGVLVVRGPSGAGKTTLLRVLARLQPCAGGEVFLGGVNWRKVAGTDWRASVHYLSQKPVLFDGTAAGNMALPYVTRLLKNKSKFDPEKAKTIMRELLLKPELWEQEARTLSGGESARLALARALLIEPKILLLDEPAAALDEKSRAALYGVVSKWLAVPGRAAVLVSHNNDYTYLKQVSFLDIIAEKI